MADNITLNTGSGGALLRTDDDGTAHWQYVKLAYGADNTQTIVGSTSSNPLPVALSDTDNAVLDSIVTNTTGLAGCVGGSELQVDIVGALPAGTNAIGKLAANSGVDIGDVDVTSISAGANLIGDVGLSGARTSGGTTLHYNGGTSTLTQIKATGGQLYWISVINLKASVLYLQIFNLASASVTLGTTTPTLQFPVPTQGDTNGAGFMLAVPNGIALGTGISYAITTTAGGAVAASSSEAFLNCGYA